LPEPGLQEMFKVLKEKLIHIRNSVLHKDLKQIFISKISNFWYIHTIEKYSSKDKQAVATSVNIDES
jgi:hypothetical protein